MERFKLQEMIAFNPEKMAKVDLVSTRQLMCGLNCFEPGQAQKTHAHAGADKLYYVVEGRGDFQVGGETQSLGQGELLHVPENVEHGVRNTGTGRLAVLVVIAPNLHG